MEACAYGRRFDRNMFLSDCRVASESGLNGKVARASTPFELVILTRLARRHNGRGDESAFPDPILPSMRTATRSVLIALAAILGSACAVSASERSCCKTKDAGTAKPSCCGAGRSGGSCSMATAAEPTTAPPPVAHHGIHGGPRIDIDGCCCRPARSSAPAAPRSGVESRSRDRVAAERPLDRPPVVVPAPPLTAFRPARLHVDSGSAVLRTTSRLRFSTVGRQRALRCASRS